MFSKPLFECAITYEDLLQYQLHYENPHKRELYKKAFSEWADQKGSLKITRTSFDFSGSDTTTSREKTLTIRREDKFYEYLPTQKNICSWYVNFADSDLFAYYGTNCFAQDEIQTLEMPLLAHIREYLLSGLFPNGVNRRYFQPYTCEDENTPTPFLIQSVPQWLTVKTSFEDDFGQEISLYGKNFIHSTWQQISKGINVINEPHYNNIIAMSAPPCGHGEYSQLEIEHIVKAVLCAFEEAVNMTKTIGQDSFVTIHTGNWGCGAFGGKKECMYLSQLIGAKLTGVDEIVFHTIDEVILQNAIRKFSEISDMTYEFAVAFLCSQKYFWEITDGN
jgi:hypothetical protein